MVRLDSKEGLSLEVVSAGVGNKARYEPQDLVRPGGKV